MILGLETSCDETAAALVTEDGEIRANVVSSQADLHARYGGVVPEVASRRHLELVARSSRGARRGGRHARRRRGRGGHAGPGLVGALLVGERRRRRSRGPRSAAGPSTTCTATSPRSTSSPTRVEPPFLCLLASGGHTLLLDVARSRGLHACSAPRSTTRPARRSTRARACSASATRAAGRSTGWRRSGDPEAFSFPVARLDGLDFSFSGVKTALLYAVRDLGTRARRAPISPPRTSARSCARSWSEPGGRGGAAGTTGSRSSAASRPTRSCASRPGAASRRSPLCTDNAAMIASAGRYGRRLPYPRYLDLDAYASRA